jgi:hypothetical protein
MNKYKLCDIEKKIYIYRCVCVYHTIHILSNIISSDYLVNCILFNDALFSVEFFDDGE